MKIVDQKVTYLDHMGSDLSVVNAARVSFEKVSDSMTAGDEKLISYLAKHNHWSPFAHASVSFRVKAPIFVARQLVKHTVGFSWNEVSRRYVDSEPEFFLPHTLREKAENVKQGSSNTILTKVHHHFDRDFLWTVREALENTCELALDTYNGLLKDGVCPEQARMVLPQNTMTEWIWSGSLYGFARMCQLRLDSHTQVETREIAQMVNKHMAKLFPISWKVLLDA